MSKEKLWELQARRAELFALLEDQGGRGVDVAERIDALDAEIKGLLARPEGEAKHTPGPWAAWRMQTGDWSIEEKVSRVRAGKIGVVDGWRPDGDGNARLIAAAPELLGACQRLTQLHAPGFEDGNHSPYWCLNEDDRDAILSAIAKAEGGQP